MSVDVSLLLPSCRLVFVDPIRKGRVHVLVLRSSPCVLSCPLQTTERTDPFDFLLIFA